MKDTDVLKIIQEVKRILKRKNRSPSIEDTTSSSRSRSSSPSPTPPPAKRPRRRRRRIISDVSLDTEENSVDENSGPLAEDIQAVFGEDPTIQKEFGEDIHPHIAVRWTNILKKGINSRMDIIKKHLPPGNCNYIQAPKLNDEIKAAVQDTALKRDSKLAQKQTQLGAGITCVGKAISEAVKIPNKDVRDQVLKHLGDAGQILTDLHYLDSLTRRSLLCQGLNKNTKDAIKDLTRDKWLFSEALADKLKALKACNKSAADIKIKQSRPATSRPRLDAKASTSTAESLNWRGSSRRSLQNTLTAGSYRERRTAASAGPSAPRRAQTSQRRPQAKRS